MGAAERRRRMPTDEAALEKQVRALLFKRVQS
jgi:hypothetical protein